MVSDEMVKAAQGYFIKRSLGIDCGVIPTYDATKCALEAALRAAVPEGEPVAWQRRLSGPKVIDSDWHCVPQMRAEYALKHGRPEGFPDVTAEVRPLYTHPAPRPDMERELAEARAERDAALEKVATTIDQLMAANRQRDLAEIKRADTERMLLAERDALAAAAQHLVFVGEFCRTDDTESALRQLRAALSGASIPAPAARLVTDTMVEAAASAMVKRGERRCALHAILKAAGMSYRERTAAVRATVEAALASIPAPALAEETRSLVREPMEWTGQGRYGFSSTVSAPIPAPADKAEARREALEEAMSIVAENDVASAIRKIRALISTPARREGE